MGIYASWAFKPLNMSLNFVSDPLSSCASLPNSSCGVHCSSMVEVLFLINPPQWDSKRERCLWSKYARKEDLPKPFRLQGQFSSDPNISGLFVSSWWAPWSKPVLTVGLKSMDICLLCPCVELAGLHTSIALSLTYYILLCSRLSSLEQSCSSLNFVVSCWLEVQVEQPHACQQNGVDKSLEDCLFHSQIHA